MRIDKKNTNLRKVLTTPKWAFLFPIITLWGIVSFAFAQEFISTDFKVLDPVVMPGGYSTSTDYTVTGVITQIAISTSTATGFGVNAGYLFFPFVSAPTVTATTGDGEVTLSWAAVTGFLGWTISGYNVGQSTTASGPYTYTSVGNVTSSTRTGLTNGTPYYFVVRPEDALGNSTATSTEVSATPTGGTASPSPTPAGGCGGGSSGGGGSSAPSVILSGRAYPLSKLIVLKDGQIAVSTIAGPDARFEVSLTGLSLGNYNFVVYGEDNKGIRSSLFTFSLYITSGAATRVGGIFITPTIAADKSEVKRGDNIAIFGQSVPQAEVTIAVNSEEDIFIKTAADKDGVYFQNLDTAPLALGQHSAKSKAASDGELSSFGKAIGFLVGAKNTLFTQAVTPLKGDLNKDSRVNLADFSIAAYRYNRPSPPAVVDLNDDEKVDLIDFSIMAHYWTG